MHWRCRRNSETCLKYEFSYDLRFCATIYPIHWRFRWNLAEHTKSLTICDASPMQWWFRRLRIRSRFPILRNFWPLHWRFRRNFAEFANSRTNFVDLQPLHSRFRRNSETLPNLRNITRLAILRTYSQCIAEFDEALKLGRMHEFCHDLRTYRLYIGDFDEPLKRGRIYERSYDVRCLRFYSPCIQKVDGEI